ncbi:MAG TPA: FtsQ-type POTRA domain-containing protein [Polyangiales bacterium]|nr:FtsQ-type POTRA domain-containing protein [Polyangiales bacterium]
MKEPAKKNRHGAVLDAPDEAFEAGEKPTPRGNRLRARPAASRDPHGVGQRLWAALKVASGIVLVVLASSTVAWGVYRYALTTPRFAVRKLEIEGSRRLTEERVAKLAGIELGRNIFQFDTARAEQDLLADPWVREVKMTRQLPSTLRVELVEREASAVAVISDELYLVTQAGEPFKRLEPSDPFDLPVVTGISAAALLNDRKLEIERIGEGLELLRSYERMPESKVHPAQEVNLSEDGAAQLVIGEKAISLQLGKAPWRKKLLMASRVLDQLSRKGRAPGVVFLDNQAHPERVVVRLR